jgi:hypothetical protein
MGEDRGQANKAGILVDRGCLHSRDLVLTQGLAHNVEVCAANGDDPLRAAIKSNPKMDNASLTIVVPAIFAWLDASGLDCACTQRLLALVS